MCSFSFSFPTRSSRFTFGHLTVGITSTAGSSTVAMTAAEPGGIALPKNGERLRTPLMDSSRRPPPDHGGSGCGVGSEEGRVQPRSCVHTVPKPCPQRPPRGLRDHDLMVRVDVEDRVG